MTICSVQDLEAGVAFQTDTVELGIFVRTDDESDDGFCNVYYLDEQDRLQRFSVDTDEECFEWLPCADAPTSRRTKALRLADLGYFAWKEECVEALRSRLEELKQQLRPPQTRGMSRKEMLRHIA